MRKKLCAVLVCLCAMIFTGCAGEAPEVSITNARVVAQKCMDAYTTCDKTALSEYVAEGISTEEFSETYAWMDKCIEYDATMTYELGEIMLYTGKYLEEFCSKTGVPESKVDKVAAVYTDIVTMQGGKSAERNAYLYIGLVDGEWLAVYPDNM